MWLLGANEATTLQTPIALQINGTALPAGEYKLFALVEPEKWTLIVSKATCDAPQVLWGIPYPGEGDDVARIPMNAAKTDSVVDPFTVTFDNKGSDQSVLSFAWENTKASVTLKTK